MVTVPKIKQFNTSSTSPGTGRIKGRATDGANSILGRTDKITNLASQGLKIKRNYDDERIENNSHANELEFRTWSETALATLKTKEGDPTKGYADYSIAEEAKITEILGRNPDLNDRIKRNIAGNLNRVVNGQNTIVNKQRGFQQENFKEVSHKSRLILRRNDLSSHSSNVGNYNAVVEDIKTEVAKRGIDKNTTQVLEYPDQGKASHTYIGADNKRVYVLMNDSDQVKVAKELDEGISQSIENLIDSGDAEQAKVLLKTHKAKLHDNSVAKINKKFKSLETEVKGYKTVDELRGKTSEQRKKILGGLTSEVRYKVRKLEESNSKVRDAQRSRQYKVNYERLDKFIDDNNFPSFEALKATTEYKTMWDRLDSKGRDAVRDKLDSPSEDNPDAVTDAIDILTGRHATLRVEDMDASDWNRQMAGISAKKAKSLTAKYITLATPKRSDQVAFSKRAASILEDQLIKVRYIKLHLGRVRDSHRGKLTEANDKLTDLLHERYVNGEIPSQKEIKDYVKEFAAAVKTGELDTFSPSPKQFQGIPKTKGDDKNKEIKDVIVTMDRETKKAAMLDYMQANSGNVPTENELRDFVNNR